MCLQRVQHCTVVLLIMPVLIFVSGCNMFFLRPDYAGHDMIPRKKLKLKGSRNNLPKTSICCRSWPEFVLACVGPPSSIPCTRSIITAGVMAADLTKGESPCEKFYGCTKCKAARGTPEQPASSAADLTNSMDVQNVRRHPRSAGLAIGSVSSHF